MKANLISGSMLLPLVFVMACRAVGQDSHEPVTLRADSYQARMDVDGDGESDFALYRSFITNAVGGGTHHQVTLVAFSENEFLAKDRRLAPLASGFEIGPTLSEPYSWLDVGGYVYLSAGGVEAHDPSLQAWARPSGHYAGFALSQHDGSTRMGWMHLTVDTSDARVTVIVDDWAVAEDSRVAIRTGKHP